MFERLAGLMVGLALLGASAFAQAQEPLPAGVQHQIIWVPDYYGAKVYRYEIDQTTDPATFSRRTIKLDAHAATQNCNPNSVAVAVATLYIVCNSDSGGLDQILVLNAATFDFEKTIDGTGPSGFGDGTFNYFSGASLVGIAFDLRGNLWVSGFASNSLYRIPAASVTATHPRVDRQVVDSPDSPAGLTFDGSGNLWVVGQFSGGILLQFTDAQINVAGTYLNASPYSPNPTLCLSNNLTGCNPTAGLFDNPEGVAVFDGSTWVSNNGGNAPASTLVRAVVKSGGVFKTSTYGLAPSKPFACPGGLFAPTLAGATPQLWVNDEGFGFVDGTCGATSATQGSGVGRVEAFTAGDLTGHRSKPKREVFPGSTELKTGSPGFGGIFVQLD